MCFVSQYEVHTEFFVQRRSKARVRHTCEECGARIEAGEYYVRASGKSEGELWSTKTCERCEIVRDALQRKVGDGDVVPYGGLQCCLDEYKEYMAGQKAWERTQASLKK